MKINTTLRLSVEQYLRDVVPKTQIYLHHTVGGSAKSTFDYWQSTPDRVATAYIVERDGTVYEVFDPHYWAWHLGLKTASNTQANKQSIGIEMASEGALRSGAELNRMLAAIDPKTPPKFSSAFLYAFDIDVPPFKNARRLYNLVTDAGKYYDNMVPWRGYRYFDAYDAPQVAAVNALVKYLCESFSIPKTIPAGDMTRFDESLILGHRGILHHALVRKDKSDLNPSWSWTLTMDSIV